MATSKRQSEERGSQECLWPAREPHCLWGKHWGSAAADSRPSFGSTPRLCYIYRLAAATHDEVQRNHKGAQRRTVQLLKMLLPCGTALLPPAPCPFCPTNILATCFSWEQALNVLSLAGKLCDAITQVF